MMLWIFCYFRRALVLKNTNTVLFYHFKNSLYHYIILFYNISTSQNFIFIKILFFNISLLILYNCQFFLRLIFPRLSNHLYFLTLLLPQPLATHNPSTTIATAPKTQATDQPINNHNHSHGTKNLSAHAADLKPTGANPLKKIITGATIGATDDQPTRSTHRSTDPLFQTHHQPIPAYRSNHDPNTRPNPLQPQHQTQIPNPTHFNHNPNTGPNHDPNTGPNHDPQPL